MSDSNTDRHPDISPSRHAKKTLPPLGPDEAREAIVKELYSSTKHSMDYVTERGVKLRTGYHDKIDWYYLTVKEMLDNAIDFLWRYYPGATNAQVRVKIEQVVVDKEKGQQLFKCTVSNTNDRNIPAFQHLDKILSFDMRYGSKQNEFIISRGMLGDAMKQIATFPYVLMNAAIGGDEIAEKADAAAFSSRQWDIPMTIKANGITREIKIYVDKPGQIIRADIIHTADKSHSTNTEISVTMPVVNDDYTFRKSSTERIESYYMQYAVFTTDVSFVFEIPKIKTTIKVPALHSLPIRWNNTTSIHYYTPQEFTAKIMGVHDKEQYTVYDVLRTFKEGTQLKKTSELEMTIAELMHDPLRTEKIKSLYYQLKEKLNPPQKLSLPHSHIGDKQRKQALVKRINDLYSSVSGKDGETYNSYYLEPDKAVYKIVEGNVSSNEREGGVSYPYAFELIAVPINEELVRRNKKGYHTSFIGAVNYSISPQGNDFYGRYQWSTKEKKRNKKKSDSSLIEQEQQQQQYREAGSILDVLSAYGFSHYKSYNNTKSKRPCIIFGNLISPKVVYQGHDKTRIDASPFTKAIIEAVESVAENVQTFRALNIDFKEDYQDSSSRRVVLLSRYEQIKVFDIIEELLRSRINKVRAGQSIGDILQTQDSLWYNALPLFEKYKDRMRTKKSGQPDRDGFKQKIKEVCDQYGVTREQLGIIAAPWATIYFEGVWHDISYTSLKVLAEKGTDIIFIEKRDIVQALGRYADKWGIALVNTRGLLTLYAQELAELANTSGANIAIFTDYDIPGLLIASQLPDALWIGVNEEMLRKYGITHDNTQFVVSYNPKKDRVKLAYLKKDSRFTGSDIVDFKFLDNHKVEIDAVLAYVGVARLWDYIQEDKLGKEYPTRDYTRVIDSEPSSFEDHFPDIIKNLNAFYESRAEEITEEERNKIDEELQEVEGFIEVEKKREEIKERLGEIIEEDDLLNDIADKIEKLDRKENFGIKE